MALGNSSPGTSFYTFGPFTAGTAVTAAPSHPHVDQPERRVSTEHTDIARVLIRGALTAAAVYIFKKMVDD